MQKHMSVYLSKEESIIMLKTHRVGYRVATIPLKGIFFASVITLILTPRLAPYGVKWFLCSILSAVMSGVIFLFISYITEQFVLQDVFCVSTRQIKIFVNELEKNKESLSNIEKEILRLANKSNSKTFELNKQDLPRFGYRVEIKSGEDSVIIQNGDEKGYLEWLKYSKYFEIV